MQFRVYSPEQFRGHLPSPLDKVGLWLGTRFEIEGGIAINRRKSPPYGVLTLNAPRPLAIEIAGAFCGQIASYPGSENVQIRWGSHRARVLSELMFPFAPSRRDELARLIGLNSTNLPEVGLKDHAQLVQDPVSLASLVECNMTLEAIRHRNLGFSSSNQSLLEALGSQYGGNIRSVAESGTEFSINGAKIVSQADLWRWQVSSREEIIRVLKTAREGAFFKADQIQAALEQISA